MRRVTRRVAVTAAATALVTVLAGAAAAQPGGGSPQAGDPAPAPRESLSTFAAVPAGTVPVRLVTGDRVEVGAGPDGVPVARDIVAAARPDGDEVGFTTLRRGSAVYVVPDDALPLVGEVLDWELFNLAKLVDLVGYGEVDGVPVIVQHSGLATASATPLAGTSSERVLSSIDAVSLTVDGDGQWWRQLRAGATTTTTTTGAAGATTAAGTAARQDGGGADLAGAMAAAAAGAGIEKVWLNEVLHIALDESVPQIGAPVAWGHGLDGTGTTVAVLDTGVDPTHPDLAGKLVTQLDFTGNPSGAVDGHGHGTHVAATIAGTGAASGGLRRGVAPGADLLIGKVCNDSGQCLADAVIAGMQWAAFSGADVVNMSLGGAATDGTDPLSTSLNNLSRATGVLFVVAAGNSGPGERTVGTPAAADEAMAVAAVDKFDQMAGFSSRGPRLGDDAPKPDIAAPGVAIVAARAAGTAMGTPVDEFYTTASGTSMATPHAAGAAAIVAQLHPQLTGEQIKALLMNAALDLGHDPFAQGSGRVDLGRSVDPAIFPSGHVTFGRLAYPHDTPQTQTLTYTNVSDADITLTLDVDLTSQVAGAPAPDGTVTVDPTTLTVPAGGTAEATVTLHGAVLGDTGPFGPYRGEVRATDDAGDLRGVSRISVFFEPQRFEVNVEVIPPDGATGVIRTNVLVTPMDDQVLVHEAPLSLPASAATAQLFPGSYAVTTQVRWRDAEGREHTALPVAPQVDVSQPTTVSFDLREAVPVRFDTPDGAEVFHATFGYQRVSQTGFWSISGHLEGTYRSRPSWWALPTDQVTVGSFGAAHTAVLAAPMLRMKLVGGGSPVMLHPRYADVSYAVPGGAQQWTENGQQVRRPVQVPLPRLTGTRGPVRLVHAHLGTPDHLDAVDVDGAVVLMTATDICTDACDFPALRQRVDDAAARGAIGVVVAAASGHTFVGTPPAPVTVCPDGPDSCPPVPPYAAVPVVSIHADEAAQLIDALGRRAPTQLLVFGHELPPHLNLVIDRFPGRLPEDMSYDVRPPTNRRIVHRIHADEPGEAGMEWFPATPAGVQGHEAAAFNSSGLMSLPGVPTRTVVTTLMGGETAGMVHFFRVASREYAAPSVLDPDSNVVESREFLLDSPATRTVSWNTRPFVPGAAVVPAGAAPGELSVQPCAGCRQDDTFYPILFQTTGDGNRTHIAGLVNNQSLLPGMTLPLFMFGLSGCEPPECEIHLFDAAGEEIPQVLLTTGFSLGDGHRGKETHQ